MERLLEVEKSLKSMSLIDMDVSEVGWFADFAGSSICVYPLHKKSCLAVGHTSNVSPVNLVTLVSQAMYGTPFNMPLV